ncbi:hypothetical protein K469DRAFT_714022 [Zopfia rhizophila CBS 207.26]|uniref:Uncharacterized protein n=1 Tax=Zopfia rhizophila CBS 207.26 TaxID=1314779 RepID=A0A6A6DQ88_9PEZI|nr:hypothetical protein K469DRAFT_714022 [Zopfia rhizophila CBS 207.26]
MDVSNDPMGQGFEQGEFDLIIAANVSEPFSRVSSSPSTELQGSSCDRKYRPVHFTLPNTSQPLWTYALTGRYKPAYNADWLHFRASPRLGEQPGPCASIVAPPHRSRMAYFPPA